jgi:hypothetical protein
MAGRKLKVAVFVTDPETGDHTCYDVGDTVPAEHAKLIGKHAWEEPENDEGPDAEPSSGTGKREGVARRDK